MTDRQTDRQTDRFSTCRLDPFCKKGSSEKIEEETTFLLKAAIVKLESERIDLEEKVDSMKEAEEKMTQ